MTLIYIFITLVIDFIAVDLERFRKFNWFITLYESLNSNYGNNKYWDSGLGLIVLLAIPVAALSLFLFILSFLHIAIEIFFVISVLLYCMAPRKIFDQINDSIIAAGHEESDLVMETAHLIDREVSGASDNNDVVIMKSIFKETHTQILATVFWYLVLGITGVFLYRLVEKLHSELKDNSSEFSESVSILLNIFEWPSVRVFAIGLALAGNLVTAISALKKSQIFSLDANYSLLTTIGIAALQYSPDSDISNGEKSYWLNQFKFLITRTLVILLIFVAIMILSGVG